MRGVCIYNRTNQVRMLTPTASFVTTTREADFVIDISKDLEDHKCGIYQFEVIVPKESMPLLDKDTELFIREDLSSFKITSQVPMTHGIFRFKFQEPKETLVKEQPKKAIIRMLYANE